MESYKEPTDMLELVVLYNKIHVMEILGFEAVINRAAVAIGQALLFFHDHF